MSNKYFSVEKTAEALLNIEKRFDIFNDKKELLLASLKKFIDNESFRGEVASLLKDFIESYEIKTLDYQVDLHKKYIELYKHSLETFAEKVDSYQNARLDTEILESINDDLNSIFCDLYTFSTDFDCIADELQNKYGHICSFTRPRTCEAKDTLAVLCGGDNPEAGMIFDTIRSFIEWDEQECSYADGLLIDGDISGFKQKIILLNSLLSDFKSIDRGLKDLSSNVNFGKVTPDSNLKLLEIILEKMKERLFIDKYREILVSAGWAEEVLTDDMLKELRKTLIKYKIDSKDEICMFLSQCKAETAGGRKLAENGVTESDCNEGGYTMKTRGGGYIQLTFDYSYRAYATFKILEAYPQITEADPDLIYINPYTQGDTNVPERYEAVVKKAEELGIDISEYTDIVDIGPEYVGDNFAWDASGFYWDKRGCDDRLENGATVDDITRLINGEHSDKLEERQNTYTEMVDSYEKVLGDSEIL